MCLSAVTVMDNCFFMCIFTNVVSNTMLYLVEGVVLTPFSSGLDETAVQLGPKLSRTKTRVCCMQHIFKSGGM
jgi:hypothetical protein